MARTKKTLDQIVKEIQSAASSSVPRADLKKIEALVKKIDIHEVYEKAFAQKDGIESDGFGDMAMSHQIKQSSLNTEGESYGCNNKCNCGSHEFCDYESEFECGDSECDCDEKDGGGLIVLPAKLIWLNDGNRNRIEEENPGATGWDLVEIYDKEWAAVDKETRDNYVQQSEAQIEAYRRATGDKKTVFPQP